MQISARKNARYIIAYDWRKIKHFTQYLVNNGFMLDPFL